MTNENASKSEPARSEELSASRCYAELGIPRYIVGMMHRYERKLVETCKRGRLYGPHYINGRKYRRRKFHKNIREWNYWAAKHNRLAIGIRNVTGYWWPMPKECNSI